MSKLGLKSPQALTSGPMALRVFQSQVASRAIIKDLSNEPRTQTRVCRVKNQLLSSSVIATTHSTLLFVICFILTLFATTYHIFVSRMNRFQTSFHVRLKLITVRTLI